MISRIGIVTLLGVVAGLIAMPSHLQGQAQSAAPQHEHSATADTPERGAAPAPKPDMMAGMKASDARLDALVQKMNAANGPAKTDAIAELLTALVQEHRAMHGSMMMKMMMGGMGAPADTAPKK